MVSPISRQINKKEKHSRRGIPYKSNCIRFLISVFQSFGKIRYIKWTADIRGVDVPGLSNWRGLLLFNPGSSEELSQEWKVEEASQVPRRRSSSSSSFSSSSLETSPPWVDAPCPVSSESLGPTTLPPPPDGLLRRTHGASSGLPSFHS